MRKHLLSGPAQEFLPQRIKSALSVKQYHQEVQHQYEVALKMFQVSGNVDTLDDAINRVIESRTATSPVVVPVTSEMLSAASAVEINEPPVEAASDYTFPEGNIENEDGLVSISRTEFHPQDFRDCEQEVDGFNWQRYLRIYHELEATLNPSIELLESSRAQGVWPLDDQAQNSLQDTWKGHWEVPIQTDTHQNTVELGGSSQQSQLDAENNGLYRLSHHPYTSFDFGDQSNRDVESQRSVASTPEWGNTLTRMEVANRGLSCTRMPGSPSMELFCAPHEHAEYVTELHRPASEDRRSGKRAREDSTDYHDHHNPFSPSYRGRRLFEK